MACGGPLCPLSTLLWPSAPLAAHASMLIGHGEFRRLLCRARPRHPTRQTALFRGSSRTRGPLYGRHSGRRNCRQAVSSHRVETVGPPGRVGARRSRSPTPGSAQRRPLARPPRFAHGTALLMDGTELGKRGPSRAFRHNPSDPGPAPGPAADGGAASQPPDTPPVSTTRGSR